MKRAWFWIILAAALALRLGLYASVWQQPDRALTSDSAGYYALSQSIARGEFSLVPEGDPEIFRTPGYPAFLLAGRLGHSWHGDEMELFVRTAILLQLLLDVATVAIVAGLAEGIGSRQQAAGSRECAEGSRLQASGFRECDSTSGGGEIRNPQSAIRNGNPRRVALVAAALLALSPVSIAAANRLLSDSIFALLLTATLALLARGLGQANQRDTRRPTDQRAPAVASMRQRLRGLPGRWWPFAVAGAVMAAACYVRPVGLTLSAVMLLVLVSGRRFWRGGLVFVAVLAVGVAPWLARNAREADYRGFSSFAGDSMYWFSLPPLLAGAEDLPEPYVRNQLRRQQDDYLYSNWPVSTGDMARFRQRRALEEIAHYPLPYARLHLRGDLANLLPGATDVLEVAGKTTPERGTLEVLRTRGLGAAVEHYFAGDRGAMALAVPMIAIWAVIWAGAVLAGGAAMLRLVRRRARAATDAATCGQHDAAARRLVWLLAAVAAAAMLLPGPAGHPRFRVPVQPVICIAAAWGLVSTWAAIRRARAK